MALAGSTRMQSSTILMLALGLCFEFQWNKQMSLYDRWKHFTEFLTNQSYGMLQAFTEWESAHVNSQQKVLYLADEWALPVFTDTTERAPTFSMAAMSVEGDMLSQRSSLTNVALMGTTSGNEAWQRLLFREPKALNWKDPRTTNQHLDQFDFSENFGRRWLRAHASQNCVEVKKHSNSLHFLFGDEITFPLQSLNAWEQHCLVKVLMNAHSTCMMGRVGRFQNNIMTWVKPSNGKLIDRAARYVMYLLHQGGYEEFDYDVIVEKIFELRNETLNEEPIVQRVYEALIQKQLRVLG